jgi:homoserine dehydrogenase
MREYRLVLIGFGNVGKAFAQLLMRKETELKKQKGITFRVTGILTGRHGGAINPDGLDLTKALKLLAAGGDIAELSTSPAPLDGAAFIRACPADVMVETTPVNHHTGQPAINHIQTALQVGMHVVTANKGPVVHGFRELTALADKAGKKFYFESAVMDGAPIFSLFRETLPLADLLGFKGILNSCTNMILGRMEAGETLEEAIVYGQSIGITETDPSADIDGWDASIKVAALVNVLMGIPYTPQEVDRTGIRGLTPEQIQTAAAQGKRWKLICTARRQGDRVETKVAPEIVDASSVLYSIQGTSSYCQFELDTLPGLGIVESDPGPETTAYGMFADWLNAIRND